MALAWEPWAVPGVFAGLLALILASVVDATRPGHLEAGQIERELAEAAS